MRRSNGTHYRPVSFWAFVFPIFFFLSLLMGCVAFQAGGEIQRGRRALLRDDPKRALEHFQQAKELDPRYTFKFSPFNPSVSSYVGRAYYALGRLPDARKELEQAREAHPKDPMASLYLGLVLMQQGERDRGLKEALHGLRSLREELTYITTRQLYGQFWDPGFKIENELNSLIAMAEGREAGADGFVERADWVGKKLEEEIDRAKEDKQLEFRDNDDGPSSR